MPEDTQSVPPLFPPHSFVVYNYRGQRIIAACEADYDKAVEKCRNLFIEIPEDVPITFFTDELFCCRGKLAEISEEVWEDVATLVKSITMVVNRHVDVVDTPTYESGGKRFFIFCVFYKGDQKDVSHVYLAPSTKIRKVAHYIASHMGIEGTELLLTHQGQRVLPNESAADNGISAGSTIYCTRMRRGAEAEMTVMDISNSSADF